VLGVLECLKRERVDILFGLPGGVLLPLYDAIYHYDRAIKSDSGSEVAFGEL